MRPHAHSGRVRGWRSSRASVPERPVRGLRRSYSTWFAACAAPAGGAMVHV